MPQLYTYLMKHIKNKKEPSIICDHKPQEILSFVVNDYPQSDAIDKKSWKFNEDEIEDWNTDPLPPKRVVAMKGRLIHTRRGKPTPLDIHEEGG